MKFREARKANIWIAENKAFGPLIKYSLHSFLGRSAGIFNIVTIVDLAREDSTLSWMVDLDAKEAPSDTEILNVFSQVMDPVKSRLDILIGHVNTNEGLNISIGMLGMLKAGIYRVPESGANRYDFDVQNAIEKLHAVHNSYLIFDRGDYFLELQTIMSSILDN